MVAALVLAVWSCFMMKGRCYQPYFKRLYNDLLSQQTDQNLTEELTKIANERCQAIISGPIETIRQTETQSPGGKDVSSEVEHSWNSVSKLFFSHTKPKEGGKTSSAEAVESPGVSSRTQTRTEPEISGGVVEVVESNSETNQYESHDTIEITAPSNEAGPSAVTEHERHESHSRLLTTNADIHTMDDSPSETLHSDSHSEDYSEGNNGNPAQSDTVAHSSQSEQAPQSKWTDQGIQFPGENQATHVTQSDAAICPTLSEENQAPQPEGNNQVMQTEEDDLPESEEETEFSTLL